MTSANDRTDWVLVPVEPTEEMRDVGDSMIGFGNWAGRIYRAMLSARPPILPASTSGLVAALEEAREYFDNRADAEYFTDSPTPVPNEEMRLLCTIDSALASARGET